MLPQLCQRSHQTPQWWDKPFLEGIEVFYSVPSLRLLPTNGPSRSIHTALSRAVFRGITFLTRRHKSILFYQELIRATCAFASYC